MGRPGSRVRWLGFVAAACTGRVAVVPTLAAGLAVLGIAIAPLALAAQDVSRSFTYNVDLRQAEGGGQPLGVDFDFSYLLASNDGGGDPRGHHFGWNFQARGFQNFNDDAADADFMAGEVRAQGFYYRAGPPEPLSARVQVRFLELLERDPAGAVEGEEDPPALLTSAEEAELDALVQRALANRRFFSYDAHYRFETDQEFEAKQHVLGAGFSAEVPLLHEALDLLPRLTGARHDRYRTPPLRVWAGLEWVGGQDDVVIEDAPVDGAYGRARIEVAWSTLVVEDLVLRMVYQGQLLFAEPAALDALDRAYNGFLETWITLPIGDRFGVAVKYIDGRPPPLYEPVSTAQVALNVSTK